MHTTLKFIYSSTTCVNEKVLVGSNNHILHTLTISLNPIWEVYSSF